MEGVMAEKGREVGGEIRVEAIRDEGGNVGGFY